LATGWTVWVLNFGRGQIFVSSPKFQDRFWAPLGFFLGGYWVYFVGKKMLGYDVNHPPPSRAEVKNEWNCTSTAP